MGFYVVIKSLQNNLTCTSVPWFPKGSADTRFLINEIVVGEESDVDMNGVRMSHFEIYLKAMEQSGASTSSINTLVNELKKSTPFSTAYDIANVPTAAQQFVDYTFKIIQSGKPHLQAAIFTFGREDLIPGMFTSIINDLDKNLPNTVSIFNYYLERHIEVDGGHHSHLALEMTSNLCCTDEHFWNEATEATIASLQSRIQLWDGAYDEMMTMKK